MKKREKTIRSLIARAGGVSLVASHFDMTDSGIRRWYKHGVPGKWCKNLLGIAESSTPVADITTDRDRAWFA